MYIHITLSFHWCSYLEWLAGSPQQGQSPWSNMGLSASLRDTAVLVTICNMSQVYNSSCPLDPAYDFSLWSLCFQSPYPKSQHYKDHPWQLKCIYSDAHVIPELRTIKTSNSPHFHTSIPHLRRKVHVANLLFFFLPHRGSSWVHVAVMAQCAAPTSPASFAGSAREAPGAVSSATSNTKCWP